MLVKFNVKCYIYNMALPRRISNLIFILVPNDGTSDNRHAVRAAQRACRVAHLMGFLPFSPLLHYMTYLSSGELSMEMRKLAWCWLRRADRIWLQFPYGDDDRLDTLAYDVLHENGRLGPRHNNCEGRRPVYQLHATGDDKIGFIPVPMQRAEVKEMLHANLTVGLSRGCL